MSDSGIPSLSVKNVTVHYGAVKGADGVCLEVPEGKLVALIGVNGAGKTSVLRAICGMTRLTTGECWFRGTRIDGRPSHEIARMGVIHVPEGRGLFGEMTVLENLQLGTVPRGHEARKDRERDVAEMAQRFPILKDRSGNLAMHLSGGEASILAVARSLLGKPKLLVMDEPLLGLAPLAVKNIMGIARALRDGGLSILMVEHNVAVTLEVADWVYVMDHGRVMLQGPPGEIKETDFVRKMYLSI